MSELSMLRIHDGIAILTINNPPVNAISQAVRAALVSAVSEVNENPDIQALVISCAGKTFFAGADLKEFGKPSVKPFLTEVVDTIELSEKPIVAAIHGNALGGGLELAMACHYRVALKGSRLGLPEVKLGLMPGARGTQHLPRLVGVEHALKIIALGEPILAEDAFEIGLTDKIADDDLIGAAIAYAHSITELPPRRSRDQKATKVDNDVYETFFNRHARKFRGLDAPPAIIESVRAASELPFEEGAAREREVFLKLRGGPQNEALRYQFFAEREAAKIPLLNGVDSRVVSSVAVIGAGTMGVGITMALLSNGYPVTLLEKNTDALTRGAENIRKLIDRSVASGRLSLAQSQKAIESLKPMSGIENVGDADLVIEAAFETMTVKREIFSILDTVAKPGAVLATNTSYLDIDEIASATSRPSDVVGMHFFSPANIMKLLEIVRGEQTAPDVIATAFGLGKKIGKIPVLSGNAFGFIGNRMLAVRRAEAEQMLVEGATPSQIDGVLEKFGFAMGPFRVSDLAGLDLGWSRETSTGATLRERFCEADRRGQKTKAGYYDYDERLKPSSSSTANNIIETFAKDNNVERRTFDDEEIFDRVVWPMVNEGAKILHEGIALRESDIDVVWLNGYGWPAWTGGPMFHARQVGLLEIVNRLNRIKITPSEALIALAEASVS